MVPLGARLPPTTFILSPETYIATRRPPGGYTSKDWTAVITLGYDYFAASGLPCALLGMAFGSSLNGDDSAISESDKLYVLMHLDSLRFFFGLPSAAWVAACSAKALADSKQLLPATSIAR